MLGHLRPSSCSTAIESKNIFQNHYCSICSSLRSQYNLMYSFFINYEMTLVLNSLRKYMESPVLSKTKCPSTGFLFKKKISKSKTIEKAAQFSVLLGWIKVVDRVSDGLSLIYRPIKKVLDKKTKRILKKQSFSFQNLIKKYHRLTVSNSTNFDKNLKLSASLSQNIFNELSLTTSIPEKDKEELSNLFSLVGSFVAISDHMIDIEGDQKKAQYNPILYKMEKEDCSLVDSYLFHQKMYNSNKRELFEQLSKISDSKISDQYFVELLSSSVRGIDGEVKQKRPLAFLNYLESEENGNLNLVKAGCDDDGCEACLDTCSCCADCGTACKGLGPGGGKACAVCLSPCVICFKTCESCCSSSDDSNSEDRFETMRQKRFNNRDRSSEDKESDYPGPYASTQCICMEYKSSKHRDDTVSRKEKNSKDKCDDFCNTISKPFDPHSKKNASDNGGDDNIYNYSSY